MLKLEPIHSEKIWGYEKWIASTHQNGCQEEFKRFAGGDYPLLVKLIQANDTLSVQVHPNDEMALKLEGKGFVGKTECWYVLNAEPDSKLVYGLTKSFSKEELEKAIEEDSLQDCLNTVSVSKGDFIFIPAGTVHAIGRGLRLLEVQQSCDLTYRLYDWGRGREVHIQKSLEVINNKPLASIKPFDKEFECEYFTLQQVEVNGGWSMYCSGTSENPNGVQLLYVLDCKKAAIHIPGEKTVTQIASEEIYAVAPGEKITVEGQAKILRIKAK